MRARNIKPGFFDNEEVGELSMTARLLFIGLWCMADRDGFLEYRPKKIKARIFPYDKFNLINFLEEVSKVGLIIIWVDCDKNRHFIEIPNFVNHQRPHPKEKKSNLKELAMAPNVYIKLHEIKCNFRLMLGCSDIRNDDIRNEELQKPEKVGTFKNVVLSDDERLKLMEKFGALYDDKINTMSEYLKSSGKTYKSCYAALLSWDRRDKKDNGNGSGKKTARQENIDNISNIRKVIENETGFNPYRGTEEGNGSGDANKNSLALPE